MAAARPVTQWLSLNTAVSKQYLLPHERIFATVRSHPAILLRALIPLASALAVASLMSAGVIPVGEVILFMAWFCCGLLAAVLAVSLAEWWTSFVYLTDSRLLITRGLIIHRFAMFQLAELDNLALARSPLGRLVDYGSFTMTHARPKQALRKVKYIPYPEQIYLLICALIYPEAL
jgi:hypothetical protein